VSERSGVAAGRSEAAGDVLGAWILVAGDIGASLHREGGRARPSGGNSPGPRP